METAVEKLCHDIEKGLLDKMWMTLVRNRSAINHKCKKGLTPLLVAILNKRENFVQTLLEEGADPNAVCEIDTNLIQEDGASRTNPLIMAVLSRIPSVVRMLLHHGAKIDCNDSNVSNVMSKAVIVGDTEILDMLANNGAEPKDLLVALHRAVATNNSDVVKWLISKGADVNGEIGHMVPLLVAANSGNYMICKLLLQNGALLNEPVGNGKKPEAVMVRAVLCGLQKAVETLIQLRADLDIKTTLEFGDDRLDSTLHNKALFDTLPILHIAVMKRNLAIVKMLVEGGCNTNAVSDKCQDTCLHVACKDRSVISVEILRYLLNPAQDGKNSFDLTKIRLGPGIYGRGISIAGTSKNSEDSVVSRPARGRGYGILRGGLKSKTALQRNQLQNINCRNFVRQTPLQIAVAVDNMDAIRLLLYSKAGLEGVDHELPGLIHRGQIDIIEMLLQAGLDLSKESSDPKGKSLLMYAAACGDLDICQLLLDSGAQIQTRTNTGDTLLHMVVAHKNPDIVGFFIDLGCALDAVNSTGTTPLMHAARTDCPKVCELLIKKGSNINLRDQNGETALSLSVYFGQSDNCSILLRHGADPDMTDNRFVGFW